MSRHNSGGSYGHRIHRVAADHYRLTWTVDRYVKGSRLRFPTGHSRDTGLVGARRFAKKWHLDFQEPQNV